MMALGSCGRLNYDPLGADVDVDADVATVNASTVDASGEVSGEWMVALEDPTGTGVAGLSSDSTGNVFVTANHDGTLSFAGTQHVGSGGNAFVGSLSEDGSRRWSNDYSGSSALILLDIAADADGQTHAVGYFAGTATFGALGVDA